MKATDQNCCKWMTLIFKHTRMLREDWTTRQHGNTSSRPQLKHCSHTRRGSSGVWQRSSSKHEHMNAVLVHLSQQITLQWVWRCISREWLHCRIRFLLKISRSSFLSSNMLSVHLSVSLYFILGQKRKRKRKEAAHHLQSNLEFISWSGAIKKIVQHILRAPLPLWIWPTITNAPFYVQYVQHLL